MATVQIARDDVLGRRGAPRDAHGHSSGIGRRFGGRGTDGRYWLLEVDQNNQGTFYTDQGFHAIGSGSVAAQVALALMAAYEPLGRSTAHLRLVAYRTAMTCINALGGGYGVGGDVHLWESDGGADFRELDPAEIESVKDGVDKWTTIERESLDRVTAEHATVDDEQVELPPQLDEPAAGTE